MSRPPFGFNPNLDEAWALEQFLCGGLTASPDSEVTVAVMVRLDLSRPGFWRENRETVVLYLTHRQVADIVVGLAAVAELSNDDVAEARQRLTRPEEYT